MGRFFDLLKFVAEALSTGVPGRLTNDHETRKQKYEIALVCTDTRLPLNSVQ
jgi:hypothetical protein